jgi:chaperone LolA
MLNKIQIAILIVLTIIAAPSLATDVNDIIEEVQDRYDDIDYLSARFSQIETFELTGAQSQLSGKIYIAGGEKYRFESEEQTIITDGDNLWAYNVNSEQVIIDKVKENSGALLPRDLLYKYPKEYYSTLIRTEGKNNTDIYVIKLEPRENVFGYLKSIKIWVNGESWLIEQIETTDLRNTKTKFIISNIDTKTELKDTFFQFEAPKNVQVMDRR